MYIISQSYPPSLAWLLITSGWFVVIGAYLLRFLWPDYSQFLNYGQRESLVLNDDDDHHRNHRTTTSQRFLRTVLLWNWHIPKHFHWQFMYSVASVYNVWLMVHFNHFSIYCLCYQLHLLRRVFECFTVHKFARQGPGSRVRVVVSLAGISFYVLSCPTILFGSVTGGDGDGSLRNNSKDYDRTWLMATRYSIRLLFAILFVYASKHQWTCHRILANLGKRRVKMGDGTAVEQYQSPFGLGDWYNHLSCPHYTAEIVLYSNFAIAEFMDSTSFVAAVPLVLMMVFVCVNLCFTGWQTHQSYLALEKSRDDESNNKKDRKRKHRWAVIPFIL